MFKLEVTEEQYLSALRKTEKFSGGRSIGNDYASNKLAGFVAEATVMVCFGISLLVFEERFDDGAGIIFGDVRVDIKTMLSSGTPRGHYANNVAANQLTNNSDAYLFCRLDRGLAELWICGWLPKEEFKQRATFHPKGSTRMRDDGTTLTVYNDFYEIRVDQLRDVSSPDDLIDQIEYWERTSWKLPGIDRHVSQP